MDVDCNSDNGMLTDTAENIAATAGSHDASTNETGDEMESVNGEKSLLAGAVSNVKVASTRRA
jgi:hypothetical protein